VKHVLPVLLTALVVSGAFVATETPGDHELIVNGQVAGVHRSHPACVEAARASGVGTYACKAVTAIAVVGVCDEEAAPAFERRLDSYACKPTASQSYAFIEIDGQQREPYPSCRWIEVGTRLSNCDDPDRSYWTTPDGELPQNPLAPYSSVVPIPVDSTTYQP
jgi:hypothetical protein